MEKDRQCEDQMQGWLKTFGLPGILSSVTATDEVPAEIWTKIEEF
jgi:hypothetical protein